MAAVSLDPISAVAGAAGSLFDLGNNIFGGKKERRLENLRFEHQQDLADSELIQSILDKRNASNASEQNQSNEDKNQKRFIVKGVLVFVAVLIFILVWTLTKNTNKKQ